VLTLSRTSPFHHQLSPFSSTHSPSPLPLSAPPLPALASFPIHRSPPPPLSLGPDHMQEGRPGRRSSEKKKKRGKTLCCYFYRRALPFSSAVPKEGGIFYDSQSQDFNPLPALASLSKICSSISCNKWLCFPPTSALLRHLRSHFSGTPGFPPSAGARFGQLLLVLGYCRQS